MLGVACSGRWRVLPTGMRPCDMCSAWCRAASSFSTAMPAPSGVTASSTPPTGIWRSGTASTARSATPSAPNFCGTVERSAAVTSGGRWSPGASDSRLGGSFTPWRPNGPVALAASRYCWSRATASPWRAQTRSVPRAWPSRQSQQAPRLSAGGSHHDRRRRRALSIHQGAHNPLRLLRPPDVASVPVSNRRQRLVAPPFRPARSVSGPRGRPAWPRSGECRRFRRKRRRGCCLIVVCDVRG